jgi:hypothetical protein
VTHWCCDWPVESVLLHTLPQVEVHDWVRECLSSANPTQAQKVGTAPPAVLLVVKNIRDDVRSHAAHAEISGILCSIKCASTPCHALLRTGCYTQARLVTLHTWYAHSACRCIVLALVTGWSSLTTRLHFVVQSRLLFELRNPTPSSHTIRTRTSGLSPRATASANRRSIGTTWGSTLIIR